MKGDSSSRPFPSESAVKRPKVSIAVEHGAPSIPVRIDGELRNAIVDTGSTVSILQPGISRSDVSVTALKPFGVTGEVLDVKGRQYVPLEIGGHKFYHPFLVCSLPTEAAGLLGTDFLIEHGAAMNLHCNKMSLDVSLSARASSESPTECTALTVFTKGKEGHSPQPSPKRVRRKDEQFPATPPQERSPMQARTWIVIAKENITLAPRCRQVVIAKLEFEKEKEPPTLVCIEPAQIPVEGIFPARALTRVGSSIHESPQSAPRADDAETGYADSHAYVLLTNFSKEILTVPKSTVLGVAEEVSEQLIDEVNPASQTDTQTPPKPPRQKK